MPLKSVKSIKKSAHVLSDTSDLNGTCHLNPFMPLKYFMPLQKRGDDDTLASPARGLPLKSVKSVKSVKYVRVFKWHN